MPSRYPAARWAVPAAGLAAFAALAAADPDARLHADARAHFAPIRPADVRPADAPKVALGRALLFDPRLSADGTSSCYRCHLAALHGTDALPTSVAALGHRLRRNAPTVFNTSLHASQHWGGELADVEAQAEHALSGPGLGNADAAVTAPYFHDGSVATLPEAVRVMARVQLGLTLPEADGRAVVAFLGALTGDVPPHYATAPALPPGAFGGSKGR